MNAYEIAQSLKIPGTDSEIVAQLQMLGITVAPINRATLVHVLNMRGMLRKVIGNNSGEKWSGTVLAMQDAVNAAGTADQKSGMALWLSHITNPTNLLWDTTRKEFAAAFKQLRVIFADTPGMPSDADFQALVDLGGGYLVDPALTVEQFAAARTAAAQAIEQAALQARIINATALMRERLNTNQTAEQQHAVIAQAWQESV